MFEPKQAIAALRREPEDHKGRFGRALILAGSTGFAGAGCLCARACLGSGAGLVTLGVPRSLLTPVAAQLTACMTRPFPEVRGGAFALGALPAILDFAGDMDVVALGPGIGRHRSTQKLVHALVQQLQVPAVIDADGLNNLEGHAALLDAAPAPRVLTPHPGEMARLSGAAVGNIQTARGDAARDFAREHGVVLVLKGHRTVVSNGEEVYENPTGNPGMASGGTGDVLTGVITALVGQGLGAFEAAALGAYLHGLAGDLAAAHLGQEALTATVLLDYLGAAFVETHRAETP